VSGLSVHVKKKLLFTASLDGMVMIWLLEGKSRFVPVSVYDDDDADDDDDDDNDDDDDDDDGGGGGKDTREKKQVE
jgi:hypothetical protein